MKEFNEFRMAFTVHDMNEAASKVDPKHRHGKCLHESVAMIRKWLVNETTGIGHVKGSEQQGCIRAEYIPDTGRVFLTYSHDRGRSDSEFVFSDDSVKFYHFLDDIDTFTEENKQRDTASPCCDEDEEESLEDNWDEDEVEDEDLSEGAESGSEDDVIENSYTRIQEELSSLLVSLQKLEKQASRDLEPNDTQKYLRGQMQDLQVVVFVEGGVVNDVAVHRKRKGDLRRIVVIDTDDRDLYIGLVEEFGIDEEHFDADAIYL